MAFNVNQIPTTAVPGVQQGMLTANALEKGQLENQYASAKAQYAPSTLQAEALSKLAYANLMGPQFLAKLMGNNAVVANSPQLQDPATINRLYQAGMGQGTGNALAGGIPAPNGVPTAGGNSLGLNGPLSGFLVNALKNILGGGQQAEAAAQPASNNPMQNLGNQPNLSGQDRNAINNMKPGDAYTVQGSQGQGNNSGYAYNPYGTNATASPQQVAQVANQGNNNYAENAGRFAGITGEGQEAGKIRAQQIKDLDETVFNAQTKQATLDDVNNMIASPEIREIRQLPLLGRHEMSWYAKEGTPAQQQLVGRLYAQMGNIIKDSSRDFAGQFRRGEQQLLQGMKPSDSDTVDTMSGKAESLTVMNQLLMKRAQVTSQLMQQYHMSQGQAQELADKEVKGDVVRQQVHDKLNPTVTIRNRKTGAIEKVPVGEARNRGVSNV